MRAAREAQAGGRALGLMPRHTETRILPYTPEQLFDLVADVGRYQEFLPWVAAIRIRSDSETEMVADLVVGFNALKETFTSRVTQGPARARSRSTMSRARSNISTTAGSSRPTARAGPTSISASISPSATGMFEALAGQMFDRALRRMIGAFEERAARALRRRRVRQQQLERAERRLKADAAAAAGRRTPCVSATISLGIGVALGAGEDDGADRLAGPMPPPGPAMPVIATATSALGCLERALRHRPGDRDRDRAERLDHVLADARAAAILASLE